MQNFSQKCRQQSQAVGIFSETLNKIQKVLKSQASGGFE
jgi:hypothetical protein